MATKKIVISTKRQNPISWCNESPGCEVSVYKQTITCIAELVEGVASINEGFINSSAPSGSRPSDGLHLERLSCKTGQQTVKSVFVDQHSQVHELDIEINVLSIE